SDGFFTTSTSFSTWRFPKTEKKIATHEVTPSAKDTKDSRRKYSFESSYLLQDKYDRELTPPKNFVSTTRRETFVS
ncbi:MAG: hypothetical protein AAB209_13895, partial [Bacteroidota bacterium]